MQHVADQFGLGLGVGFLRPRGGKLGVESPSCCADSVVLLVPTSRLDLARKSSTLASASSTFCRIVFDLAGEPLAGALRLLLLGLALPHQIAVGDGVGDLRGELGISEKESRY